MFTSSNPSTTNHPTQSPSNNILLLLVVDIELKTLTNCQRECTVPAKQVERKEWYPPLSIFEGTIMLGLGWTTSEQKKGRTQQITSLHFQSQRWVYMVQVPRLGESPDTKSIRGTASQSFKTIQTEGSKQSNWHLPLLLPLHCWLTSHC